MYNSVQLQHFLEADLADHFFVLLASCLLFLLLGAQLRALVHEERVCVGAGLSRWRLHRQRNPSAPPERPTLCRQSCWLCRRLPALQSLQRAFRLLARLSLFGRTCLIPPVRPPHGPPRLGAQAASFRGCKGEPSGNDNDSQLKPSEALIPTSEL